MEAVAVILIIVVIAVLTRVAAGGLDHDRIRTHVNSLGGRVIDIRWSAFGPGWFGSQNVRIYNVRYVDRDGHEHETFCKTSMWSGVYFTEDRIVSPRIVSTTRPAPGPGRETARHEMPDDHDLDDLADLIEENERLRDEIKRLKRRTGE